ncbi:MAG: lysoplasmalogenase family protein [Erythrobacter sp.]
MARRALIEHRPWLLASVTTAIAYYFVWNNPIGGVWLILLKGAGVGLLAVYAWRRSVGADGSILAGVLALSAAGDIALELSTRAGGALFAAAYGVAIALYFRNGAGRLALIPALIAIATPIGVWLLTEDIAVTGFGVILGIMAGSAWASRFPNHRVGVGTLLIVASDILLFSRMGTLDLGDLPDVLVWPLYYAGHLMIATGVVQTLRGERTVR